MSVFVRYRRATAIVRLQLRWFAWAAGLFGALILGTGAGVLIDSQMVNAVLVAVGLWAVSAAVVIAVLRYRLYDIDRVVSRTLTYVGVTAVLAGTYVLTVVALRATLAPLTGTSELAVAGSTLAVAALFGPVRRRIQTAVDHRFNRARYDAGRTVEQFGQRLRDEVDLGLLTSDLHRVVVATVEPTRVSPWLHPAERQR